MWSAVPTVIPFAAAAVFILSPVFVDLTQFFPQGRFLLCWLPATLYLSGCEGEVLSLGRLGVLTVALTAVALLAEWIRRGKSA